MAIPGPHHPGGDVLILGVVLLPELLAGVPKLVLVLAGIIGLLLMGAIVAPRLLLSRELVAGLKPADRLNAENQLRGTMMQGLTGLLVLAGAFVAWQQVQVGQRQLESSTADQRTTQQISREGQITDRYTRAIEQLGSESLELRLGAIYSLERIAKDSEADRETITEILTTFIRVHAPWPSPQSARLAQDGGGQQPRVSSVVRPVRSACATCPGPYPAWRSLPRQTAKE